MLKLGKINKKDLLELKSHLVIEANKKIKAMVELLNDIEELELEYTNEKNEIEQVNYFNVFEELTKETSFSDYTVLDFGNHAENLQSLVWHNAEMLEILNKMQKKRER